MSTIKSEAIDKEKALKRWEMAELGRRGGTFQLSGLISRHQRMTTQ
jgi:hypothetical protein